MVTVRGAKPKGALPGPTATMVVPPILGSVVVVGGATPAQAGFGRHWSTYLSRSRAGVVGRSAVALAGSASMPGSFRPFLLTRTDTGTSTKAPHAEPSSVPGSADWSLLFALRRR